MGNQPSRPVEDLYIKTVVDIPEDVKQHNFEYTNLVLSGGGVKTYAYVGGLKVLEELGILSRITHFTGTSGGAIIAAFLAVGYSVEELYRISDIDFEKFAGKYPPSTCTLITSLYKIFRHFGLTNSRKLLAYIEANIVAKTKKDNYTFKQLYDDTDRVLCIPMTNLTWMSLEFFSHETTPNVPISKAVQMSAEYPGLFEPVVYSINGHEDYYIDGGLLCNYPIDIYDSWFSRMTEDGNEHFIQDEMGLGEFDKYDDKTLGMMVRDNSGKIEKGNEKLKLYSFLKAMLQRRRTYFERNEILDIKSYVGSILSTLGLQDKLMMKEEDIDRTIGVYTGYMETTDFKLETGDKLYMLDWAVKGTIVFLKEKASQDGDKGPHVLPYDMKMLM